MFDIKLHKKHDMVEVIDSDDEDEKPEKPKVPDLEKIMWNCEVESQVEDILQSLCKKVDLKQQFKWQREILEKRIDKVSKLNEEMDEELKEIERKSTRMYNELYSLNKPEIKRRPSVDITHEFEPKKIEPPPTVKKIIMMPPTSQVNQTLQKQPVMVKLGVNPASLAVASQKNIGTTPQPTPKFIMSPTNITRVIHQPNVQPINSRPQPLSETPRDKVFFAVRSNIEGKMQNWAPCKLLEVLQPNNGSNAYRVQFYENSSNNTLVVRGKEFAWSAVNTKLKIGARVIAQFPRGTSKNKDGAKKYLPGVIGEKLSKYNNFRYLVFCDYGQVHYSSPDSVREVADASPSVWEDVHENLRQFIKDYLQSQMQRSRALLNARKNQNIQTEKNGVWNQATVADIDCSVIKMFFPSDNSHEWLYRGSKRFGPIYIQGQRGHNAGARRLYNDPNITYITVDDESEQADQSPDAGEQSNEPEARVNKANVAKKSTAPAPPKPAQQAMAVQPAAQSNEPQQKVIILNDQQNYLFEPMAVLKHRHFTPRKDIAAKRYEAHKCSPKCLLRPTSNLNNYSPLTKPLLTCWERQIIRQKANRWVLYKAPCGRRLRNMDEIRTYLLLTHCALNVDNFDFDTQIQVLSQYDVPEKDKCPLYIPDMSEGKEGMKIPIINPFDQQRPPDLIYSPVRIPMKGVNINTDPEFMACCDCTDDCADKTKCACFQMTIRGYKYAHPDDGWNDVDVSYVWKRLLNPVTTGIYECNKRCKCSTRCLNKVVQQPIQIKMHLIRTANRGMIKQNLLKIY